jgi:hypothetical protein
MINQTGMFDLFGHVKFVLPTPTGDTGCVTLVSCLISSPSQVRMYGPLRQGAMTSHSGGYGEELQRRIGGSDAEIEWMN